MLGRWHPGTLRMMFVLVWTELRCVPSRSPPCRVVISVRMSFLHQTKIREIGTGADALRTFFELHVTLFHLEQDVYPETAYIRVGAFEARLL